jgi:hypothetical protein
MLTTKVMNACERYRRRLADSRTALEESIADLEQPKPSMPGEPLVAPRRRHNVPLIRRLGHSR